MITMERVKGWAFFAFLLTVPIFYLVNQPDSRMVQERYFQAAVMGLASLFFGNIWLTLFMWLNLALFTYHGAETGASQVLSIFLTSILFAVSRTYFTKHKIASVMPALQIVCLLTLGFMLAQAFGVDPLNTSLTADGTPKPYSTYNLLSGLFSLPAFNAIFLTLVASLMAFLSGPIWLLLLFVTLDARCSAAIFAWAFLIPFYVYYKRPRLFKPVLLVGIIAFGAYTYQDFATDKLTYNSRFENWHLMLRHSLMPPIGWGPDSFRNYNSHKNFLFRSDKDYQPLLETRLNESTLHFRYHSADAGRWRERFQGKIPEMDKLGAWDTAHNDWLQYVFEYGWIFGLPLLIGFLREVWLRFRYSDKRDEVLALFACICVFGLTATTQFPFHLARLSGIFGIILGAYSAVTDHDYDFITKEIKDAS